MLDQAPARQRNVIVRPHGAGVTFIQLDDLKADQLPPLAPAVFLTLETSPGNYQAWVALPATKTRILRGGCAKAPAPMRPPAAPRASPAASISRTNTRLHFPRVAIRAAQPGRLTRAAELEQLGLVAAPEPVAQPLRIPLPVFRRPRQPQMAELRALRRWRAAQQRGNRPRLSAGPILSSA